MPHKGVDFLWDPNKRLANIQKHEIDFIVVYGLDWSAALVKADLRHLPEVRLQAILPLEDRLYFVTFTLRRNTLRIINVRKASNREIKDYASEI